MSGAIIRRDLLAASGKNNRMDFLKEDGNFPQSLICFSHLRWDFVYQRPQHILTTFSDTMVVHFVEEPVRGPFDKSFWVTSRRGQNIWVHVPHLPDSLSNDEAIQQMTALMDVFFTAKQSSEFIFWYYTPMALEFSGHLTAGLTVFDCMDELSAFKFAPEKIKSLEQALLLKADIVFTGGYSLFRAKKDLHGNIHPFPSSIDKKHFIKGRQQGLEPKDQALIKGPKIGFYGVLDERMDIALLEALATQRPDWAIILIGPVVKIDPESLPKNANIYYLGPKPYEQLPSYLSGWDVAIVPFIIGDSTRFVSPTKTPEYLCAGKPVVSTPIDDIVDPYGKNLLVSIAHDTDSFVKAIDFWIGNEEKVKWQYEVDKFLLTQSWDITCSDMMQLMKDCFARRQRFEHSNSNHLEAAQAG